VEMETICHNFSLSQRHMRSN